MVDLLIIGQGLAGTSLALQASKMGKTFHLVDHLQSGAASRVAAGLINPVTGRNLSTTWMADTLLPYAMKWYTNWTAETKTTVYHSLPVWRIFAREKEIERFNLHIRNGNPYIAPLPTDQIFPGLLASLGGALVTPGGWLDTTTYLDQNRKAWKAANCLTEAAISATALVWRKDHWEWEGLLAEHVVWCNGSWAQDHPFFPELPFAPTKGEILTLEIADVPKQQILIKGHFLVPISSSLFRLGATYHWHNLDGQPTKEARDILLQKLTTLLENPVKVVDHQAGVRPTVIDRKPLIGASISHPNQWLFNGLGSKGATLGPYWAEQLLQHIYQGKLLPTEVSWNRAAKAHNQ